MKLWHSFKKELKLASRGFYFYLEIGMAIILLVVLLFVIPENFKGDKKVEYLYFDMTQEVFDTLYPNALEDDLDGKYEYVEIKSDGKLISAKVKETEEKKAYFVDSKEDLLQLVDTERPLVGAVISLGEDNRVHYQYHLQGYESERLKNLYLVIHNKEYEYIVEQIDNQEVVALSTDYDLLTDKQNVIPSLLTFNGSLMGLFIIAAYIFLDKHEGVIKAFAVTATPVWVYLMSKMLVITVTSVVTSLIMIIPVMGLQPSYIPLLILLITSGLFSSAIGVFLSSFYKDITQAFGSVFFLVIAMMLPNIAYFVPSWDPAWIKLIPTYPLLQGFKETILVNGDISYVLMVSGGFLVAGIVFFLLANYRFKKTLSV